MKIKKRIDLPLSRIDREVLRQRALKELLLEVRNGAMISPIIFKIEQLYKVNED